MKVYITKYALTQGIQELEVEPPMADSKVVCHRPEGCWTTYYHGSDWHKTMKEAVAKARDMRAKRIASLKKSIGKLEALSFND